MFYKKILHFSFFFDTIILGDRMKTVKKQKEMSSKDIFYLVILFISLIIMVSSVTIAYFALVASQETDDTKIYTGSLVINFVDGQIINNPKFIPRSEPNNIEDIENCYVSNFEVKSTGSLDQTIDIYMEVVNNEFDRNAIKYVLFDEFGNKLTNGSIADAGQVYISGSEFLASGETKKYTLMLYLEETGNNQDNQQGKKMNITLGVEAIQTIE